MKEFEKLLKPDERWSIIGRMDRGRFHAITLREVHNAVAALKVTATLPPEVAEQFELARDLYVHAWYVYDFLAPADLQTLATLELALRRRLAVPPTSFGPGLKKLLQRALDEGILTEADLAAAGVPAPFTKADYEKSAVLGVLTAHTSYPERAVKFLSGFRNELGHGNRLLLPSSLTILRAVSVLLSKLFA